MKGLDFDLIFDNLAIDRIIYDAMLDQSGEDFLKRSGVDFGAIARQGVALISVRVRFDEWNGQFNVDHAGLPALLIVPPAEDCSGEIAQDLVAIDLADMSRFSRLTGRAFALGASQIDDHATYFGGAGLRLHRRPIDWLCAQCRGAVIMSDNEAEVRRRLARVPLIDCPDIAYGRWLRGLFYGMRQVPIVRVPDPRRGAAA